VIRYVLAVVLTAAILATAMPAVDHGSTLKTEQDVESEIATIEAAATSLVENEQLPKEGQDGPRRTVEVDLPDGGFIEDPLDRLVFARVPDTNRTRVRYRVDGQPEQITFVDAPVVHADGGNLELTGGPGTEKLTLELVPDAAGNPVVEVESDSR